MKQYALLLFYITIPAIVLGISTTTTSSATSTSKVTTTSPRVYIKNKSSSAATLLSLELYYGYHNADKIYYTKATGSISIPAGKLISINSSIETSRSSETPQIQGLRSINIGGTELTISNKLLGFGPENPVIIDKINNQWSIVTQS